MKIPVIEKEDQRQKQKNDYYMLYMKTKFSIPRLLINTMGFKREDRNLVLEMLIEDNPFNIIKMLDSYLLKLEDKLYMIRYFLDSNDLVYSRYAYLTMERIKDPKKYLSEDEIKWILQYIYPEAVKKRYGTYFDETLIGTAIRDILEIEQTYKMQIINSKEENNYRKKMMKKRVGRKDKTSF